MAPKQLGHQQRSGGIRSAELPADKFRDGQSSGVVRRPPGRDGSMSRLRSVQLRDHDCRDDPVPKLSFGAPGSRKSRGVGKPVNTVRGTTVAGVGPGRTRRRNVPVCLNRRAIDQAEQQQPAADMDPRRRLRTGLHPCGSVSAETTLPVRHRSYVCVSHASLPSAREDGRRPLNRPRDDHRVILLAADPGHQAHRQDQRPGDQRQLQSSHRRAGKTVETGNSLVSG
jgi:hypothetical protein